MTAEIALASTALHIARCRDDVMLWPEHRSHAGAISLAACTALDALAVAVKAMHAARIEIEEGSDVLESIADQIHDMASDITGKAQKRMEQPAYQEEAA